MIYLPKCIDMDLKLSFVYYGACLREFYDVSIQISQDFLQRRWPQLCNKLLHCYATKIGSLTPYTFVPLFVTFTRFFCCFPPMHFTFASVTSSDLAPLE